MLKRLLILCLGNEIISDDGFGPEIARQLTLHGDLPEQVEVIFASVAGFNLLDLLTGREKVLIVDTILTGRVAPGTLHIFPADALAPSRNLTTSHQISLPTALELGKRIGAQMPRVVEVVAVEAEDLETLSEELSPSVRAAVSEALDLIKVWISQNTVEEIKSQ